MDKDKLKAVWHLIWSRNWAIVCDRNTSAGLRKGYRVALSKELRSLAYRIERGKTDE